MQKNILTGLLIGVFILGIGGCGKGCAKKPGALPESSVLQLIPSGQNVLMGLDIKRLQESPFGQKIQEKIPPEAAPFIKEIEGVTLGIKVSNVAQEPKEMVGIVTGQIDPVKMLAEFQSSAQKEGQQISDEEYDGVKIYSSSKDPEMGVAFVTDKAVFGDKASIKKVVDLSKHKGDSVEKDKNLLDLVSAVDTKKMIWAVGIIPEGAIPPAGEQEGSPMGAFSKIKALDLAMDISKDMTIDLGVIAGTPEDAQQMQTMANSYKALFGASLAQKNPNLGKVLNDMSIGVSGPRMALSLKLDEATLEQLSQQAGTVVPGAEGVPPEREGDEAAPPAPPSQDS